MSARPIASSSLSCATPRVPDDVDLDAVVDLDGVGDSRIEPLRKEEGGPVSALREPSVPDFAVGSAAAGCSTVSAFSSTEGSGVGGCGVSCDSAILGGSENDDELWVGSGEGTVCISATAGGCFGASSASSSTDSVTIGFWLGCSRSACFGACSIWRIFSGSGCGFFCLVSAAPSLALSSAFAFFALVSRATSAGCSVSSVFGSSTGRALNGQFGSGRGGAGPPAHSVTRPPSAKYACAILPLECAFTGPSSLPCSMLP